MADYKKRIQELQRLYKQYLGKRTLEEYLTITKNNKTGDEETMTDPLFRDMIESKLLWGYSDDNVLLQQQRHKIHRNNKDITAKPDFETNNEFCKVPILFDAKSSNISFDEMTSGTTTVYETTFKKYLLGIKPGYKYIIGFNLEYIFLYEKSDNDILIKIIVHIPKLFVEDKQEIDNFNNLIEETQYAQMSLEDKIQILQHKVFEDTPFNTDLFFEKYVNTRNKLQKFFVERLEINKINKENCDDYIKSDLPNSDNDHEFRVQLANRLTMIEFFKYIFIRTYEDFGLIHFSEEDKKVIPVSYGKVMENLKKKKQSNDLFEEFPFEEYIEKISKQGITDIGKQYFDGFSTLFKKYEGFIEDLVSDYKAKYNYYHVLFDIIFFLNEFNFKELGDDIIGGLYEKTLDREDRKKFGQFYTPRYIINFILDTLAVKPSEHTKIADMSCGTGGFLVKYLDRIKGDLLNDTQKLADIFRGAYGVDIKEFSILLTRLNIALMFILKNKALKTYNLEEKKIRLNSVIQGDGLGIQNTVPFKDSDLDFVVGNPPYVGQKGNSDIFDPIKSDTFYKTLFVKRSDLYYYFIIDGIKKLKPGGKLGYIIPREWITSDSGHKLRQYILDECKILGIIDFNGISIFEDAGTSSCILLLQKDKAPATHSFSFIQFQTKEGKNLVKYIEANKDKLHKTTSSGLGEAKQKIDSGYEIFAHKIMEYTNFEKIIKYIEVGSKYDISLLGGITPNKIILNDFITIKKITQTELGASARLFGETIRSQEKLVKLGSLLSVSQGIVTGCDSVTKKHIEQGLATSEMLGRGIFVLQENLEIRGEGLNDIIRNHTNIGSIKIKGKDSRLELNDIEKKLIKPMFGGKDLRQRSVKRNNLWVIYYHTNSPYFNNTHLGNIIEYFSYYKPSLINRCTLGETIITDHILQKTNNIRSLYSTAGSVQATLGKGIYNTILFPRSDVPFDTEKIVRTSKGNPAFSYSDKLLYGNGGGQGGLNYIFINGKNPYTNWIDTYSTRKKFLKFINIILNSSYIKQYLEGNNLNSLSVEKLREQILIPQIDFEDTHDITRYHRLVEIADLLIGLESQSSSDITLKLRGADEVIDSESPEYHHLLTTRDYKLIDGPIGLELQIGTDTYMIIGGDHEALMRSSHDHPPLAQLLGIILHDEDTIATKQLALQQEIDTIVESFYRID